MNKFVLYPLCNISPKWPKAEWVEWLAEEVETVRQRFGSDEEALTYWPDDYYERMESWWRTDRRCQDPVKVWRHADGTGSPSATRSD
jgi:hypothetical protein